MGKTDSGTVEYLRPNMRPLKDSQHEAFAVEVAVHNRSYAAAFKRTKGLPENARTPSTAHAWAARPEIQARIKALKQEVARKEIETVSVSRSYVIDSLKEVVERALQREEVMIGGEPVGEWKFNATAANKALELLGKNLGLWDGKSEAGKSEDRMTDEELIEALREGRDRLESIEGGNDPSGSDRTGTQHAEAAELPTVSEAG